jgi:hypothetical protein
MNKRLEDKLYQLRERYIGQWIPAGEAAIARGAWRECQKELLPIIEEMRGALSREWPGEYGAVVEEHNRQALARLEKWEAGE